MPQAQVVVDPDTGNVLLVHRRSIGTATTLFFLGCIFLISARYVDDDYREAFRAVGSICFSGLLVITVFRCCTCCCRPKKQSSGYVIVTGRQQQQQPIQPGYPVAPQVMPVISSYPNAGVAPPFAPTPFAVAGAQPAFNPNHPPPTAAAAAHSSHQNESAPPMDAPPSYSEATGIPLKQ